MANFSQRLSRTLARVEQGMQEVMHIGAQLCVSLRAGQSPTGLQQG